MREEGIGALACCAMLSGLESPMHLLLVLIVAMLVFGPKRLPQIGRSLGSGIRELRNSLSADQDERDGS
jgi:sec-independent protein translocase protein TatA